MPELTPVAPDYCSAAVKKPVAKLAKPVARVEPVIAAPAPVKREPRAAVAVRDDWEEF